MNNTYFYHPDHLGSTSLVTNSYGEITQNISYIPYGEIFVEETSGGWQSPYYFNAKELDEETGLYYYGARYLDPAGARWLSADPMLEKYMGMSPYNYCAGNPVRLVDPDGRENAIYVIDLQSKNRKDKIDTKATIKKANEFFESLGLKTRAYEVDPKKFAPSKMDATDSYVVIGSYDQSQKSRGNNPMKKTLDFLRKDMDPKTFNDSFNDWYGSGTNPERTATNGGRYTREMAIDGSGAYKFAEELNLNLEDFAAFLMLHGAGHNAGYSHVLSVDIPNRPSGNLYNAVIMAAGSYIDGWIRSGIKLQDLVSPKGFRLDEYDPIRNNDAYVDAVKRRYGKNISKSCF